MLGGKLGGRSKLDAVEQAVQAALRIDAPVKVTGCRSQAFAEGADRAGFEGWSTEHTGQDGLDRVGPRLVGNSRLDRRVLCDGVFLLPDAEPGQRLGTVNATLPITTAFWPSVCGSSNGFFRACFVDECAAALQRDAAGRRLELLSEEPRVKAVLN